MRLTRLMVALLTVLGAAVHAQSMVVTEYVLSDLSVEPGTVVLSPNYLTLMEFPDLVETVATGRADLLQVEVDDNRILLRPTRNNGRTDLIVKVSGVNAMFRIEVDGENGTPRRYVVHAEAPPEPTPPAGGQPAATVERMPSETLGWGGMQVPGGQPQSLPYEFTYSARVNDQGLLTIHYTLTNRSVNPLANDGTRLRVLDELGSVPFSIVRMNTDGAPNRLRSGFSEHGVITMERAILGAPRLEWPVVEQGPGLTYIINELVVDITHD